MKETRSTNQKARFECAISEKRRWEIINSGVFESIRSLSVNRYGPGVQLAVAFLAALDAAS